MKLPQLSAIAAKVRDLLTGESLRAINYGAVAVVYLVVKAAVALGYMQDAPDFDGIAIAVGAAIAAVTELARHFVFSPNTVEALVVEAAITGDIPAGTPANLGR